MLNTTKIIISAIILTILFFGHRLYSQDQPVNLQCVPDSMHTIYQKYKIENPGENDLKIWYSLGSEYARHAEYDQALPYLWKVFIYDSTKIAKSAIRKIADSYFSLKIADSTLVACYLGLEKFPNLQNLHYYAGVIQGTLGNYSCAVPHYEYLVGKDSTNEAYLEKLAALYFSIDDERAIKVQRQLADLYPDNPAYSNRLLVYLEHWNYDLLNDIRQAFQKDSGNVENGIRLAEAEYEAGNYEQAEAVLNQVLNLVPDNFKALKIRAQTREDMGNYPQAIEDYRAMLSIKPGDMDIMCALATQYKRLNRFAEGANWAKLAISKHPGKGLPHIVMAELYEASVTFCQEKRNRGRKIDDGLVYEKAIGEYRLAMADPAYSGYAKRRIELLEPFRPTTEEIFFSPEKQIKYECYTSWVDD